MVKNFTSTIPNIPLSEIRKKKKQRLNLFQLAIFLEVGLVVVLGVFGLSFTISAITSSLVVLVFTSFSITAICREYMISSFANQFKLEIESQKTSEKKNKEPESITVYDAFGFADTLSNLALPRSYPLPRVDSGREQLYKPRVIMKTAGGVYSVDLVGEQLYKPPVDDLVNRGILIPYLRGSSLRGTLWRWFNHKSQYRRHWMVGIRDAENDLIEELVALLKEEERPERFNR
ncbi:MAG: hypothetical protein AAB336_13545 [Acidobacteriota bacterium]